MVSPSVVHDGSHVVTGAKPPLRLRLLAVLGTIGMLSIVAGVYTFGFTPTLPFAFVLSVILSRFWADWTGRRGLSYALGLVLWASFGLLVILTIAVVVTAPGYHHGVGRRTICLSNLKQLGLAILQYNEQNDHFPLAYTADANGKPLCSWRTMILPYLDKNDLYAKYHADEPWDGPNNAELAHQPQKEFVCPADFDADPCDTSYVAVIGPGTAWEGSNGLRLSEIKDDPHDTILLVEMKHTGIKWSEPRDLDLNNLPPGITPQNLLQNLSNHPGCFNPLFADGHQELIPSNIPWADFQAMLTIAGGEKIDREKW